MSDRVLFMAGMMSSGIRWFLYLFFLSMLFEKHLSAKNRPDRRFLMYGFLGMLLIGGTAQVFAVPEWMQAALETVCLFLCTVRLQVTDRRMCLFLNLFFEIGLSLWQYLSAGCLGILFGTEAFLIPGDRKYVLASSLFHLALFLLAGVVRRCPKEKLPDGERTVTGILIAGILLAVTMSEQTVLRIPEDFLSMWTIQSVILLMAVLIYRMRRLYDAERLAAQLKAEQAELLERDYTALNRTYEVHAKLFHDLHNHMDVLRQMLVHEKYEAAMEYLEELNGPMKELTDQSWTGDDTVDYLINRKQADAKEAGICMEIQVEYPRHTGIRSADLSAVLGNLLDNGLEAAGKVSGPEAGFVRLVIRRIHQMVVIKVENSFSEVPVAEGGRLLSRKRENGLHSWGLQSARTAVERYDGTIGILYEGGVFRAVATMCCRETMPE